VSSGFDEVRDLLSALTLKFAEVREVLSAQAVGNSLYGMQSMSTEAAEVRALLSVLTEKIKTYEYTDKQKGFEKILLL
jgi:hypothetical protein